MNKRIKNPRLALVPIHKRHHLAIKTGVKQAELRIRPIRAPIFLLVETGQGSTPMVTHMVHVESWQYCNRYPTTDQYKYAGEMAGLELGKAEEYLLGRNIYYWLYYITRVCELKRPKALGCALGLPEGTRCPQGHRYLDCPTPQSDTILTREAPPRHPLLRKR